MKPAPNCDLTPGLTGLARAREKVHKQRAWIEWCESGGSYNCEHGDAVRQADTNELKACEAELQMREGR